MTPRETSPPPGTAAPPAGEAAAARGLAPPPESGVEAGSLRIALLSDAIPSRNGVGTYYDDLVLHLRDRVGEVRLLSPPPSSDAPYAGWALPMPGDPTQRLYVPSVRQLWREVRDLDPHVVISATPGVYGVLGMALAARTGAGFGVGYHTQIDKLAGLYWKGRMGTLTRRVLAFWDRFMFRRDAVVLVHNEDLVEVAERAGADDVRLMGTPTPRAFVDRPLAPLGDALGSVLFVGRLAPEKELGQILEAARALPDLHFRIAGDGPLRDEVEAAARDLPNVEAPGWVDRDRVLELLDASDLLVLPSRYETFGSAAFESMIRRRGTLVSPHCGIARWPDLADGLFLMRDGEPLVEALRRVRDLPAGARREVADTGAAAARAMLRHTVDHWVRVLGDVSRKGRRVRRTA